MPTPQSEPPASNDSLALQILRQSHALDAALRQPTEDLRLAIEAVATELRALHDDITSRIGNDGASPPARPGAFGMAAHDLHLRAEELREELQHAQQARARQHPPVPGFGSIHDAQAQPHHAPAALPLREGETEDFIKSLAAPLHDQADDLAGRLLHLLRAAGYGVVKLRA